MTQVDPPTIDADLDIAEKPELHRHGDHPPAPWVRTQDIGIVDLLVISPGQRLGWGGGWGIVRALSTCGGWDDRRVVREVKRGWGWWASRRRRTEGSASRRRSSPTVCGCTTASR